eukprot:TRINITY_DN8717_c0_g1_i1.p1 TRINITY_DN8717_c0_g1~~TRINITY_DN8717_c0_g1_i1.p1  ORF type:complete len:329 (-),score=91.89 TRINITY_DN8717_c0_g1_i1:87-1073(-)
MKRTSSVVNAKKILAKDKHLIQRILSPSVQRESSLSTAKSPRKYKVLISPERRNTTRDKTSSPISLGKGMMTAQSIDEARFDEMEHRYREEIEELTYAICNGFRIRLDSQGQLQSTANLGIAKDRHEKVRNELQAVHEKAKLLEQSKVHLLEEMMFLEAEAQALKREEELESLRDSSRILRLAIAEASKQLGEVAANEQTLEREVAGLTIVNRNLRGEVDALRVSLAEAEGKVKETRTILLQKDEAAEEHRQLLAERAELQRQLAAAGSALASTVTRSTSTTPPTKNSKDRPELLRLRELLTELERKSELLMRDNRSLNNLLLTAIGV